jgi:hypothetical protein
MGKGKPKRIGEPGKSPPGDFVINLLVAGDDRNCVLMGGGFIEYCTEQLLRKYFSLQNPDDTIIPKLLDKYFNFSQDNEPFLCNAFRQAALVRLLGLMSDSHFKICNKIRGMRNTCAHHVGNVYLSDRDVDELMGCLTEEEVKEFEYWEGEAASGEIYNWGERHKRSEFTLSRRKLMHVCLTVSSALRWKTKEIDPNLPFDERGLILGGFTPPPKPQD